MEVITKKDLAILKNELIKEFKSALQNKPEEKSEWLKTWEVKKLVGLSNGTLQKMRNEGTIPFTKLGGLIFYKKEDVLALMQNGR
jgi:excisionase family DNA binding protein